jgi:hypothetical protein
MNRHPPPPEPVPFTLQPCGPVAEHMDFIEQHDDTTMGACRRLGTRPHAVPETRQGGLGAITRRIETLGAGLSRDFEQKSGLPHLTRPGQELDPSRRRFGEALPKKPATVLIVHEKIIPE